MHCISISHKTAPTIIRQIFSFTLEEKEEFEIILKINNIKGCVVVSTCNRCEIYFSGEKSTIEVVEKEMAKYKKICHQEIKKYFHIYSNEGAIKHLFKVTSGLDSMVLGEDEILRQVKEAYQLSLKNNCTSNEINIAFQGAINNAKRIKTETNLSNTSISIGTLTSNRIMNFLNSLNSYGGYTILIVGITGKIGSIVANNLGNKSNVTIIGTSRNHNVENELFVKKNCLNMINYKDRYQYVKKADVIVSATQSPHYTFTYHEVIKELDMISNSKLFVDLAVPYDIDKDITNIKGIQLIDIDYFEKASEENNILKQKESEKAEIILQSCIDDTIKNIYFQKFYKNMDKIINKVDKKGFSHILFQLKESLNWEQFEAVLDSLQDMIEEED
jgi:glutamyl-tRNA reductase